MMKKRKEKMEILRNMWRRKFRTFLTIFGITVGIFAFTVMGSMALKLNKMIDGGKKYITGQITIMPKGTSFTTGATSGMLPIDTLNKIKEIEGVDQIQPVVTLDLDEPDPNNPTGSSFSMSAPPTITGSDNNIEFKNKNWETLQMKEGQKPKFNKENEVSLGYNVAIDKDLKVGDTMRIRGRDFIVRGIVDKTMSGPDSYVFMNIKPAREMLIESNPFLKSLKEQSDSAAQVSQTVLATMPEAQRNQVIQAKAFKTEDINTMAGVAWKDGTDPEQVVQKIRDQFKDEVVVLSPKKMGEEIDKATVIFNTIVLGTALIALIVGGFSIINTMIMSVSERTKEIGIKKALGASGRSIATEYTLEAGIIGLLGGLVGMGLGILTAFLINNKMAEKGGEIFLIEPNFLIEVIVFAFVLGIISGLIPAYRASKMKAVDAIREL